MQGSISLSFSTPAISRSDPARFLVAGVGVTPEGLSFSRLQGQALRFCVRKFAGVGRSPHLVSSRKLCKKTLAAVTDNGSTGKGFDYDLVIIGAGVGGHGAALHAVEKVRDMFAFFRAQRIFWALLVWMCKATEQRFNYI